MTTLLLAACVPSQPVDQPILEPTPVVNLTSDEQAELIGFEFIQAVVASAPPADPSMKTEAFELLSEAAKEQVGGSAVAANLASFVGIQDVPDQGVSVEDLAVNEDQAELTVGLNYSGSGRVLKVIHLIVEGGTWRVDRVSPGQER